MIMDICKNVGRIRSIGRQNVDIRIGVRLLLYIII